MQKNKGFFSRWVDGMKRLTSLQLLHAKLVGSVGSVFGLFFASIFLALRGLWYFLPFLFFGLVLQVVSLVGVWQQYVNAKVVSENVFEPDVFISGSGDLFDYTVECIVDDYLYRQAMDCLYGGVRK